MVAQQERKTAIIGDLLQYNLEKKNSSSFFFLKENDFGDEVYDECDSIIISMERLSLSEEKQKNRVIFIDRSINKALKKGLHVCILCNYPYDPLFARILSNLHIQFIKCAQHISEISIRLSEFDTFLKNCGTAFGIFSGDCGYIISTTNKAYVSALLLEETIKTDKGQYIVGFTRKKENGIISFLPFYIPPDVTALYREKMISELQKSLETHRINIEIKPPGWINEIKLKKEKDLESIKYAWTTGKVKKYPLFYIYSH